SLDALVGAGSAAASGIPVLLTSRTGVPAVTLARLKELKVTGVTVVGSTVALPDATLNALSGAGVVQYTRLAGADRWKTAVTVADRLGATAPDDRVVLANGREAAGEMLLAAGQGRRILLADQSKLPADTVTWLKAHP